MSASRAFTLRLIAAGATDIGRRRKHNEDAVLLRPDLNLFLLADGAGGHNAGNLASALAVTSIANFCEAAAESAGPRDKMEVDDFGLWVGARRLAMAVQKANRDIVDIAKTSKERKGMGSTIVAALFAPTTAMLHLAHVGDSRCYRLRDGRIEQLTQDHSLINDVLETRPDMADDAIKKLPTNVVTRALGMDATVRVSVRSFAVAPGDRYLLCSDGLSGGLLQRQIGDLFGEQKSPSQLVQTLVDAANEAGGHDNIAAVVVVCEVDTVASVPARAPSAAPVVAESAPPAIAVAAPYRPVLATIPPGDAASSVPEILLVGIEDAELQTNPQFRLVPDDSGNPGMLDAIDDFVGSMRLTAPGPLESQTICAGCGNAIDTPFCPHCGELMGIEEADD